MDMALRRRFVFVEQMPNPDLLDTVDGINLADLLRTLNQRIEVLLGNDYLIGHSYLMNIDDIESLHFAWYRKIVPLLQEYFYNDWERLKAVIGDKFVQSVKIGLLWGSNINAVFIINSRLNLSGISWGKVRPRSPPQSWTTKVICSRSRCLISSSK